MTIGEIKTLNVGDILMDNGEFPNFPFSIITEINGDLMYLKHYSLKEGRYYGRIVGLPTMIVGRTTNHLDHWRLPTKQEIKLVKLMMIK